jgi:tetratricopeptide (TPR) repeat protein
MTEALITDLVKTPDLRVISRAAVMRYKGVDRPLSDIARELNVGALLMGSVIRTGDRVRVSVSLVHAPSNHNLWAQSYERDMRDVLDLQSAVSRDVVGRIRSKLSAQDDLRVTGHPTVNPEAYDHYLRGKFHLHRQKRADNDAAIAALESAVAADPSFAAAHAELAQAYVWKLFLFDPAAERKWAEKAFVASEKAIAMDPNLAVAYLARGRLLWTPANHFPHDRVIMEYRKALSLDPNLDEARNQLALVYNHVGAFDEALRELQTAVATNPGNTLAQFRIGETILFQGKYEEALNSLRAVPNQTNPALVGHQIVWALFNLGRKDEALETVQRFIAEHPDENRALLESIEAVIAASDGRRDDAERHIQTAISRGKGFGHFHHTTYHIAVAYAYMDRPDESVKWLETTAETGFPCYPLFERDKNLDKIRSRPVFVEFLNRMKQRWEVYRAVVSS